MTDWKIPLADLEIDEEEIEAVNRIMRSRWLTMGPQTEEFERSFARYHAVQHAVAVSSGTAALHLAYAAVGVSPGDEIVMPSLTFVATANAALMCGAKPVFAEIIDLEEPTIDPRHVNSLITSRTRAIVAVHYAGYPCRSAELADIAQRRGVALIEDCAHAPGLLVGERHLGTWGTAGCFSFFSNKNMTTGEGGMVVSDDSAVAERIRRLRSHGMTSGTWKRHHERPQDYDVLEPGWNYRTDEIRAAIGLVQLRKLAEGNRRRAEITRSYREQLRGVNLVGVAFEARAGVTAAHILPLLANDSATRLTVVGALADAGVQTSHHYPPIHLFSHYRERFGYCEGMLPKTELFSACEATLPLYTSMRGGDIEYVTSTVRGAVQGVVR